MTGDCTYTLIELNRGKREETQPQGVRENANTAGEGTGEKANDDF